MQLRDIPNFLSARDLPGSAVQLLVQCSLLLLLVPAGFAQKTHELCNACHTDQTSEFLSHPHAEKGLSCDVCHGASVRHRTSTGSVAPDRVAAPDEVPALCGTCHSQIKDEYSASKHGVLVLARSQTRAANCATCHDVHASRAEVAMLRQCQRCHSSLPASHPKMEAKASCFTCHSPHSLSAKK